MAGTVDLSKGPLKSDGRHAASIDGGDARYGRRRAVRSV
jgi:hypothetical protein